MSSGNRKKRKVYGAVRDFDEDSLEQGNDKDDESDVESSNLSNKDDNSDDDFSLGDSDAENNSVNLTEKQSNKKKKKNAAPVPEKKKRKTEKGQPERKTKKGKTKASPKKAVGKKAIVKVESDPEKTKTTINKDKDTSMDTYDVLLPSPILNGGGGSSDNQCTLLVEVSDSNDAIALGEFGGSIGAIGRFESDSKGITLDLKGNQYRGSLLPGPTCLVVGFPQSFGFKRKDATIEANGQQIEEEEDDEKEEAAKLRVEAVVDEYATIVQIDDHMKKLDAIVVENHDHSTEGETI